VRDIFYPRTLKEFTVEAKIVDVAFPPYSVSRYTSADEAIRVCIEADETLYRDDWER